MVQEARRKAPRKVRNPYMNITQNIGIRICGTGSSVPTRTVTNDDMATIVETSDEWISTRTGISERHFADQETNLSLGTEAAEKAIAMAGIPREEIGVVICATRRACSRRAWVSRNRSLPLTSAPPAPVFCMPCTRHGRCSAPCRKRNTPWLWQANC